MRQRRYVFIFHNLISFHCFGLPWLPIVGGHFRPFTEVLRKDLCGSLRGKMRNHGLRG